MAIFESNIDYTKLIQLTNGTLRVASFVEIRDALIKRFKEIYGSDIDISSASADGQYVNSVALIINNILQTIKLGFNQLDPSEATGEYLDVICSYNNIERRNQSASIAELYIYNDSSPEAQPNGDSPTSLQFIDRNGETWLWNNPILEGKPTITFKPGETTIITNVICDKLGPVQAQGNKFITADGTETDDVSKNDWSKVCPGWIYTTINSSSLKVWQYKDAIIGTNEETDESLRSRRYQLLGNRSVSVLEGLQGSLMNLSGIQDVFIFNNFNNENYKLIEPVNDGTTVDSHSIYVALRYKKGITIDKSTIGGLIYNKLTPGIGTSETNDNTEGCSLKYEISKTSTIKYIVYWKKCHPIYPYITIKLKCNSNLYDFPLDDKGNIRTTASQAETEVEKNIVNNLQNYLSQISIDEYVKTSDIMNKVQISDKQKQGLPTFYTLNCEIKSSNTAEATPINPYPMNLNYFDYNDEDYEFKYSKSSNDYECIITISHQEGD